MNNNILNYRNRDNIWTKFGEETIKDVHGDMFYYRDLYDGKHGDIFPRAKELIEKGEIIDLYGSVDEASPLNVRTPYLMFNVVKQIVNIPSMLVSRSIGQIKTNYPVETTAQERMADNEDLDENAPLNDIYEGNNSNSDVDDKFIEVPETNDFNDEIDNPQQDILDQIIMNSKLNHRMNITQLQVDGGIVSVPTLRNNQIAFEIKERNVYYPHEDELGADLVYELPQTNEEQKDNVSYVHVYTERQEGQRVVTYDRLYIRDGSNDMTLVTDPEIIKDKLYIDDVFIDGVLTKVFEGRQRPFITYLANEPTFTNTLGNSSVKGLAGKQEEVNWTITRAAQTFERNGKPRISVSKATMERLQQIARQTYGNEGKIDHRNLEVTEFDENGRSIQIHQIDTSKIGDMSYVKEIVRAMLAETQTSESAIELVRQESASSQSGIAKFYDLMVSIIKSESMRDEYVEFLKDSIEAALWFANKEDQSIIIERPNIILKSMLPQPKQELSTDNIAKYNAGVQSLEETVRSNNPDKSEEWIREELKRIADNKNNADSLTINRGEQTLQNFLNNRNADGQPLDEDGQVFDDKGNDRSGTNE